MRASLALLLCFPAAAHAVYFATCTATGTFGISAVPKANLAKDVDSYSKGKMALTNDPLFNGTQHSLISMMVYMDCDLFLLGKHTWSQVVFQVPHVKRTSGEGKTHFLAQPSCYTTCSLAVLGDSILAWSSKHGDITPINASIWEHGSMTKPSVVTSSFQASSPWMNATSPEALAFPAWQALVDATSKLGMIGVQTKLPTNPVECSSMVYQWEKPGARVRQVAGSIDVGQDVSMPSTIPAGSSLKYDGKDGSAMQVETSFVMGFPEACPRN